MVIFLAIYPVLLVAGVYVLDRVLPIQLVAMISGSVPATAALCVVILAAVTAAALRNRQNTLLMSAWFFLFCGLAALFLGSVVDLASPGGESVYEDLLSVTSFFPLLFFALFIAAPSRLLIMPRRRRLLLVLGGVLAFLSVFAVVFFPWLLLYQGPQLHSSAHHLLRLVRPIFDLLLSEPIAFLVLALGATSGSGPYFLVGIGLILFVPEDILDHFQVLRQIDSRGLLSQLFMIGSRLYLLNGALLAAFRNNR